MRSLTLKLTLVFFLIGVVGMGTFALLVGQRTQSAFDLYRSARDQSALAESLSQYYIAHGSWEDVTATVNSSSTVSLGRNGVILVGPDGLIVAGDRTHHAGDPVPPEIVTTGTHIDVNGQTVGYLLSLPRGQPNDGSSFNPPPGQPNPTGPGPQSQIDATFLDRLLTAALTSAGITALVALVLGVILARTLTRPIAELTAATKVMASGKLGQRVQVRSRDEIGTLATAFNHMSTDLARASQLRKQMTADLAHDLRTPLSILRGYTEGLKEGRLRGTPAIYDIMHGEVEHLQRLVEDLRTLSLADSGELPLNRRAVDPKALLERTGLAYIVQAEQHNVALRIEAAEGLPSVWVDTDRMTQVLNNLVSNALRYTTQGEIVLSTRREDHSLCLRVSDTGAGIEPEHLPFIFDRFYRADPSRQRNGGADNDSSGLGLAIAKALVEAHGGTITAESTPGHGTSFTICLPIASERTQGVA